MRVVIDTNTTVSGLLWHGAPHTVLDLARAEHLHLYASPQLLLELDDVLHRLTIQSPDEILHSPAALRTVVDAPALPHPAAAR